MCIDFCSLVCVMTVRQIQNMTQCAPDRAVAEHRKVLGQKYGYETPSVDEEWLKETKDPRQVFYGLQAGWVVDLKDKAIYKPADPALKEYYQT